MIHQNLYLKYLLIIPTFPLNIINSFVGSYCRAVLVIQKSFESKSLRKLIAYIRHYLLISIDIKPID